MPTYKLYYFDHQGNGEICRLLLSASQEKWEDMRIPPADWPSHKEKMPLKAMPVLEIDGKQYCQTNAIARYLARTFNFYGSSPEEQLQIDEIHESVIEMGQASVKMYLSTETEDKKKAWTNFKDQVAPKHLAFIEKRLQGNKTNSGFIVGSSISLADICVFNFLNLLKIFITMTMGDEKLKSIGFSQIELPKGINALMTKVASNPGIAAWLKKQSK